MSHSGQVVVVGGGMAGLMAASRLRERGFETLLVEADGRVGGQICTRNRAGWIHEGGPALIGALVPEADRLLEAAGVGSERVELASEAKRRLVVHDGAVLQVPATAAELVNSPLLTVAGRLRMLREPFVAKGGSNAETVTEFATRRLGQEAARRLIDPVVRGNGGGDPDRLLARHALGELVRFEQRSGSILKGRMRAARQARQAGSEPRRPWGCRSGLGRLPELLAAALGDRVRTGSRVTSISRSGAGFRVDILGATPVEAVGVVVATSAALAADLTAGIREATGITALNGIRCRRITTISLGYRCSDVARPLDAVGIAIPSSAGLGLLSVAFSSSILPNRAPQGSVLLGARLLTENDAGDTLTATELVAIARREFGILLGITAEPMACETFDWEPGVVQPEAGHDARLAVADKVEAGVPGLVFCGAWRDGAALANVIRGGLEAGDRVVAGSD